MKHFLIYTNKHKDQELATTKRIQNYLETKGCTVKLKVKESDCCLLYTSPSPRDA